MYGSQWGSLSAACSLLKARYFYCKSHENSYQYYKLCDNFNQYYKLCDNFNQYYKSHENPYQVMQVTCAASERGMKSMVCYAIFLFGWLVRLLRPLTLIHQPTVIFYSCMLNSNIFSLILSKGEPMHGKPCLWWYGYDNINLPWLWTFAL